MSSDSAPKPESGLWKDYLNFQRIENFAKEIGRNYKHFDQSAFVDSVINDNFKNLELKERIKALAHGLKIYLPDKYSQAIDIIKKTAPHTGSFENWALMAYIEFFGLDHFEISVPAMRDLTCYSSAEFAIRPYMIKYTDQMMSFLTEWTEHENEHIRRLSAEASRPRGVWVAHLDIFKKDPRPVLKLLENLKADPSLYVRKAVANNLNDISKDNPDILIKTALKWKKDNHYHTDWILKHACRSLIKSGEPRVYPLFGFTPDPDIKISGLKFIPQKVTIGDDLNFSFTLTSNSSKKQKLAIDYKIFYLKKNGSLAPKVFKLSEKSLPSNENLSITKKHSFKNFTTRKHYSGKHKLQIVINGQNIAALDFILK